MTAFETYEATARSFKIELRFSRELSQARKDVVKRAADRWCRVIVGALPFVLVGEEMIEGVVIDIEEGLIDDEGIVAKAGWTHLRPPASGSAASLPAKGSMILDTERIHELEEKGILDDVITHEMGHVLGIGTLWEHKNLLNGKGTDNPTFVGRRAMEEYGALTGAEPTAVPVENEGDNGFRDVHWREKVFTNELLTGWVNRGGTPIIRITVASLEGLGYVVDMDAAETYI